MVCKLLRWKKHYSHPVEYFVVTNSVITHVYNVKQQEDSHAQQISF